MPPTRFQAPSGTRDLYPQDLLRRRYIEKLWRDTALRPLYVTWTAFAGQPLDLCRLIARALTTPPPDHHPTTVELLTQSAAGGVPRHKVARPLNF